VILVPSHRYNLCADVVGIFQVNPTQGGPSTSSAKKPEWVVLLIQCRDWLAQTVREDGSNIDLLRSWRWGQQFGRLSVVQGSKNDLTATLPNPFIEWKRDNGVVDAVYVLVSANPVDFSTFDDAGNGPVLVHEELRPPQLLNDEGLIDFEDWKRRLPTVGYNVIAAHRIRRLFVSPPEQ
jgi:hypothetical protein